jgi:hypothetical protein
MSDKIVLKNTTDSEATLVSRAEGAAAGSPDELQPGELIVQKEVGRTTLYSTDSAGSVIELPGRPQNPPGELNELSDTQNTKAGSLSYFYQDFDSGTPVKYTFTSNTYLDTTSTYYLGTGSAVSDNTGSVPMNFDDDAVLDQTKRYDYLSFVYYQESFPNYFNQNWFIHFGGIGSSYTTGGGYLFSWFQSSASNGGNRIYWGNDTVNIGFDSISWSDLAWTEFTSRRWNTVHILIDWGDNPAPTGRRESAPVRIDVIVNGIRVGFNSSLTNGQDAWIPLDEHRYRFRSGRTGNSRERGLDKFYLGQSDVRPWPSRTYGHIWDEMIANSYGESTLNEASTLIYNSSKWQAGAVVASKTLNDLNDVNTSSVFDPYWDNVTFLLDSESSPSGRGVDVVNSLQSVLASETTSSWTYKALDNSTYVSTSDGHYFDLSGVSADVRNGFDFNGVDFTVECWTVSKLPYGKVRLYRAGTTTWEFSVELQSTSGNRFVIYQNGTFIAGNYFGLNDFDLMVFGQWRHVAVCGVNGSLLCYVNGILRDTISYNVNGWGTITTSQFLSTDGYSQGARVTKGVARYLSNFTPPKTMPRASGDKLAAGQTLSYSGSEWQNSTAINGGTFGSG